jgi:hypothetical protein
MISDKEMGRLRDVLLSRPWLLTGGRLVTKSSVCMRARATAVRREGDHLVIGLWRTDGDGDTERVPWHESDIVIFSDVVRIQSLFLWREWKIEEGGGWRTRKDPHDAMVFTHG